jgi:hypothetical protein
MDRQVLFFETQWLFAAGWGGSICNSGRAGPLCSLKIKHFKSPGRHWRPVALLASLDSYVCPAVCEKQVARRPSSEKVEP